VSADAYGDNDAQTTDTYTEAASHTSTSATKPIAIHENEAHRSIRFF
jgi:hypothetical protein